MALARERYAVDVPGGAALTDIQVATWYTRQLLRDAYIERQQLVALSGAQTTAAAAAAQAITDANTSIT